MRLARGLHRRVWSACIAGAPAAALGALMATGQAPLGWWWATLAALLALFWLLPPTRMPVALAGRFFAAGCGHFALALNWLVHPFLVDPLAHAWMAPFALAAMAAGMALFWAGAGWLAGWLALGRWQPLALAVTLTGAEMLRGWLFGGFPWAMPGHVWVGTPVAQLAALAGAPALTFLVLAVPALPFLGRGATWRTVAAGVALAALGGAWVWGTTRVAQPLPERELALHLRLVQPNAPQHLKWHPDHVWHFFHRQLELTAAAPEPDAPHPELVIWPETAVPFLLERPGEGLLRIADAAGDAHVALGVQRFDNGGFFNSLAIIDPDAELVAVYDKHHLVPFGEYVPFAELLLGRDYAGFAAQQLQGYSHGPGPRVIDLGAFGKVLPMICYETIFARHLRVSPRADWVLQVTNDAWFGNWSGPRQHLAQARLRAIEQGLPVVRVANTGISAIIDARGDIVAALALNTSGVVDAALPGALGPTAYARTGDTPTALALALAVLAFWRFGPAWRRRDPR